MGIEYVKLKVYAVLREYCHTCDLPSAILGISSDKATADNVADFSRSMRDADCATVTVVEREIDSPIEE